MQTKHYVAAALAAGIIIGGALWFIFAPRAAQAPASPSASTTSTTQSGVTIQTTGSSTITVTEQSTAPKPPALRQPQYSASTSADVKATLAGQYDLLASQLRAAPTRVDLWLQLGVLYKIAGDYAGAEAAWTYVAHFGPASINFVAYGDLGDLYLNFLHNYAAAEASYKLALKGAPTNADYQAGLKAAQQQLGH